MSIPEFWYSAAGDTTTVGPAENAYAIDENRGVAGSARP